MIIKRYIVSSMNEAMTRIRYELGTDAVIISQRKIRKPGIKGLFSPKNVEVTAAIENKTDTEDQNVKSSIEAIKKVVQQENVIVDYPSDVKKQNNEEQKSSGDAYPKDIMNQMKEMKDMIKSLAGANSLASANSLVAVNQSGSASDQQHYIKSPIESVLEYNDVDSENIEYIMGKINDFELENDEIKTNESKASETLSNGIKPMEYEKLKRVLKEMIHVTTANLQGKIVLVGPTGVGKTTTIAKLAGRLALVEKKKVGLITVDTYRIGAVEQLKTYADIMNIPFEVVYNMKDMDNAIASMSECEVILIDTTGRSSKNKMQISELRTFVEKVGTENIHLVLSSTTKNRDIKYIIEGYQILHYNSIIVTKLDETSTYGSILNILQTAKTPLSFVATGQNVPDDIKELSPDKLISLILGEDTIC